MWLAYFCFGVAGFLCYVGWVDRHHPDPPPPRVEGRFERQTRLALEARDAAADSVRFDDLKAHAHYPSRIHYRPVYEPWWVDHSRN